MRDLTPHEERVLELIRRYPEIVNDKKARTNIAAKNGISEKTLRNRIADLRRYGLIKSDGDWVQEERLSVSRETSEVLPSSVQHVDLFDYVQVLFKRRLLIASIVLATSIISATVVLNLPLWYKATSVILPPAPASTSLGALGILGEVGFGNLLGTDQSQNRYLAILKSNHLLSKVVSHYDLREKYKAENREQAVEILRERNMEVEVGDEMQISVSLWDQDQDLVAEMTEYVIFSLDSLNIALSTSSARNNRDFIETRFEEVLDSLNLLQNELVQFMEQEGVLSMPDQLTVGVQLAAELKAQVTVKEIELEIAQKTFQSNDPKIRELEYGLESLRNKYHEFFTGEAEDRVVPSFSKVPDLTLRFERFQREIGYYSKLVEFIGPQYEQARIEEAKDIPTLQVLDRPLRPEEKDKPKRTLIVIISFSVSSFLAVFGIILLENYKTSKRMR